MTRSVASSPRRRGSNHHWASDQIGFRLHGDDKIIMEMITEKIQKIKRAFLDALFPIYCLGCEREGVWLCADCLSAIRPQPLFLCPGCGFESPGGTTHLRCLSLTPLSALVSPYHYAEPAVRRLIKEYKYHGATEIENILIGLTASGVNKLRTLFPAMAIVVPMPLHGSRERARGFNQAAVLGGVVSRTLGFEMSMPLKRLRRTEEQARLETAERHENCRGAFSCAPVAGDVILVDDVITSGATMSAAAAALRAAGAEHVVGFALAHGRGDRLKI